MLKRNLLYVTAAAVIGAGVFASCKKSSGGSSTTTNSNVKLKDGLLLYLPFDGNYADSSGNGNQVTVYGGAGLAADEHGNANQAFGENGAGRLSVANNGSIKFDTAFSVSMNFVLLNSNSLQCLMSMTDYATGYGAGFSMGLTSTNTSNFGFGTVDASAGCDYFAQASSANISDATSFYPSPGSWYNVVCIAHKGAISTYVNGTLVSTKQGTGTDVNLCAASQVIIGNWWSGGEEPIYGRVDEVRMYNRVLNADEIAELSKEFTQ